MLAKICSTHSSLLRHHNAQLSCTLLPQTHCIESSADEAAVAARCWHDDTHSSANAHMNLSCTRSAAAAKLQIGVAFLLLGRHICRLAVLASADRQRSCQLLSLPAMVERERRRSEEPERGARERRCDGQVLRSRVKVATLHASFCGAREGKGTIVLYSSRSFEWYLVHHVPHSPIRSPSGYRGFLRI